MVPGEQGDAVLIVLENGDTYPIPVLRRLLPKGAGTALLNRCPRWRNATGDKQKPLYDIGQAAERVAAAVEAARALPFPFTLTARSENFLRGNPQALTTPSSA